MRLIPASAHRRMPWRNGGGETIEIAVSPPGASLDAFDWRVSMARVAAPGPFSLFPRVDRTLAVLDGGALVLRFQDGRAERLTPDSEPLAFPADVAVEAELPDGAITDLNVMSRRGRVAHSLRRIRLAQAEEVNCSGDEALLLVTGADIAVRIAGTELRAKPGDAVLLPEAADAPCEIVPDGRATLYVVEFRGQ